MGYSEALHHAEAESYAAQYPSDTAERIQHCPTDSAAALRACIEEAVASSHEAQRSERDLNAQRDMAKWAWWLMVISLATLVVSALGLVALLRTIQQGQEGLERAGDANDIARSVARNEMRPFLYPDTAEVTKVEEGWIEITIHLKNFGRGPARALKIFSRHFMTDFALTKLHDFVSQSFGLPDCAPSATRRVVRRFLYDCSEQPSIFEGKYTFLIRLQYSYADELGAHYKERIDYHIDFEEVAIGELLFIADAQMVNERREFLRKRHMQRELFDGDKE